MKFCFYLCVALVYQGALAMQCKGVHLHPRLPARGAPTQAERVFEFNQHDLQCRTEKSSSLPEMQSIVCDQLLVSFAIAERTHFHRDIDFFLADWREEFCARPECQLAHLCEHERKVIEQFTSQQQCDFCASAIKHGLLPETVAIEKVCANPCNRLWLFKQCYHFIFPDCKCYSVDFLFCHAVHAGIISKKCTYKQFCIDDMYKQFCIDDQLQRRVRATLPHRVCIADTCKRKCAHETDCAYNWSNTCAGRDFPFFLSRLSKLQHADAAALSSCADDVHAFLCGLSSPDEQYNQEQDSTPRSPDSLTLSPDTSAPPTPVEHGRLAQLKSVLRQNWHMLGTLLSFSWQEFKADDDHEELKTEEEGGWYFGTASPATQMARLVAQENLRKEKELKELSDVVATTNPPTRTFYYQRSLTEAQKKNSDDIIRACMYGMTTSPFKGTMYRNAQARSLGLFNRVVVRQCAQTCLRCLHEKEEKEQALAREQAEQTALLAWMAKQEVLPMLSRKKEICLRSLTEK